MAARSGHPSTATLAEPTEAPDNGDLMFRRPAILPVILSLVVAFAAGCTTSRAVLAWRAGASAEQAGDIEEAMRRYDEAYGRDGNQYGAELAAIRLILSQPDRLDEGEERLDKVLAKRATRPDVAAFGALWSLARGDIDKAAARLEVGRVAADAARRKANGACEPASAAWLRAQAAVAATAKRWKAASEAFERVTATCGPSDTDAAWMATIAWNLNRSDDLDRTIERVPAESRHGLLLRALAARNDGRWAQVAALLERPGDDGDGDGSGDRANLSAMRAEAHVHLGHAEAAVELAEEAVRAAPESAFAQQVLALSLLSTGRWQRARDLLAGLVARGEDGADWTIAYDLAIAELRLGRLVEAVSAFERAARQCPNCLATAHNLEVLRGLGLAARP